MEEKDNLEKAMTLMSSALKQYEEGKFDVAEHSRQEANKIFDEINNEMSTQDGMDKMRFGENRNFGMLYSIFENNSKKLYTNNQNQIVEIVNTIKNNPILVSEFKTYNAFLNPMGVTNPEEYVNEAVQLTERFSPNVIKEANTLLLSTIRNLHLDENTCPSAEDIALYEDIEYVITNKPDITNISAFANVKRRLSECVRERNTEIKTTSSEELKETIDEAYDSLSSKYNKELTKDEIELVESLSGDEKKAEKHFNNVKEGLLKRISKELNVSEGIDKQRWNKLKESIQSKSFNKQTALIDMAEMIEASGIIEE